MGLPGEVLVVDVLRHRDLGDIELCGGGHQVPLVHPPVLRSNSISVLQHLLTRVLLQLESADLERMMVVFRK